MPGTGQASVEAQGWVGALPEGDAPEPTEEDEPCEESE